MTTLNENNKKLKTDQEISDPTCRKSYKTLEQNGIYLLNAIDYTVWYCVFCKKWHIFYKQWGIQNNLKYHFPFFLAKIQNLSEFWQFALGTSKLHVICEMLHY